MSKRIRHFIVSVLSPALILGVAWFSGCENEKEIIKTVETIVRDTVTVNIISVDSIYALADSVTEGATIQFTANTTLQAGAGALTFKWFASGGEFHAAEGDTVEWTAPDEPGVYIVSVHATDGTNIGIGTRQVGVAMYIPTVTPFFLGDVSCINCHSSQHSDWAETGHAHAWQTLMESGHPQSFCFPCHAVGYEPSPLTGNSGYDEAAIEKFVNVQCENCHGAASDHLAGGTPDPTKVTVSFNVNNCSGCHDGTHHPFYSEWLESPHNLDVTAHSSASCSGCHEGVAAAYRLSGDLSSFYGSGAVAARPDTSVAPWEPINCVTCHDPHNTDNPGQLRTVADVPLVTANGDSPIITEGGVGKLCMHCHHARRGPDAQVVQGYGRFGPHANPQADMMQGASAYHAVADPSFEWADPSHLNVENSCKTCHLSTKEFGQGPGGAAYTGHTFLPKVDACVGCHGAIADFDDIRALEDFDGDGSIEGIQSEVTGLIHLIEGALIATGLDTTGNGFEGALGDTTISNFVQRGAGYNMLFVEEDKSLGVHNPDYAIQILQQSYQYLTGAPVPNAVILKKGEHKAVSKF